MVVQHIAKVLQERDAVLSDWMLNEALNVQSLQHGGTFRNALIRKIDEVIIPIFAEIIDYSDHHCNLDLIHDHINVSVSVKRFWLSMFKCDLECKLHNHPVSERDYNCKLPFSWVIKECMDSLWSNLITTGTIIYYI